MGRLWNEEEIQEAIELYKSGKNFSEIGKILERPKVSVNKKLKDLGIAKPTRKTNKEHIYKVGDIVKDCEVLEQIRMTDRNLKGYKLKCLVYDEVFEYSENTLTTKATKGSPYKSGYRVCEKNSLYAHENIRKYIVDIEHAKTIAPNTHNKIMLKCPECDREKEMSPNTLVTRGFSCSICSQKFYPELFFGAMNDVFNMGFVPQVRNLYDGYIFDNVNYQSKTIIETHGLQHYQEVKSKQWENTHENTVQSDEAKRKWCKENGWTLIELDCRKSEFKFIQEQVNKNKLLPNINNETVINKMLEIIELNKNYPTKKIKNMYEIDRLSAREIGEKLNLSKSVVSNILRRNNVVMRNNSEAKKGVALGSTLDKHINEIIKLYAVDGLSGTEIGERFNCTKTTIYRLLKNNNIKRKSNNEAQKGRSIPKKYKQVKCIETGQVFESITKATEHVGLQRTSNISMVCNGKRKKAAGYTWEFIK